MENGRLRSTLARVFQGCAASVATSGTIPTGAWTHIAVTSDGSPKPSGMRIFLNGAPAPTTVVKDTLTCDYLIGGALNVAARGRDLRACPMDPWFPPRPIRMRRANGKVTSTWSNTPISSPANGSPHPVTLVSGRTPSSFGSPTMEPAASRAASAEVPCRPNRDEFFNLYVNPGRQPERLIDLNVDPEERTNRIGSDQADAQVALARLSAVITLFPESDADPIYQPNPEQEWDVAVTKESQVWKK